MTKPDMLSILLIDDNAFMQKIQSAMLIGFGHQVCVAESGARAIELLTSAHHFDLVLMDVQMPQMDGLETTRRLRKLGCRVPIVALTGNHSIEDVNNCYQAGMIGFIAKPMNRETVNREIARLFS